MVTFLLSVSSDTIQVGSFFTQDTKKDMSDALNPALNKLEGIHTILREQFKINRDDLRKKYSLGYALFYTDHIEKEIHSFGDVTDLLKIDWGQAKIVSFSDKFLEIRMPNMEVSGFLFNGTTIVLARGESYTNRQFGIFKLYHAIGYSEILIDEKTYIVGVFGITPNKPR